VIPEERALLAIARADEVFNIRMEFAHSSDTLIMEAYPGRRHRDRRFRVQTVEYLLQSVQKVWADKKVKFLHLDISNQDKLCVKFEVLE
jgi:hypothetical protein